MRWIVAALGLLVLGFAAGRWSVRPDPGLEARVRAYQDSTATLRAARDSVLTVAAALGRRADSLEAASADQARRAAAADQRARHHRGEADAFRRLLAEAATGPDSLRACLGGLEAREQECAALRDAQDRLLTALTLEREAAADLRLRGDTLEGQVHRDAARLGVADALIRDLRRAARGCRVPLVNLRCPEGAISYDATDGGFLVGVDYPITSFIRAGARWRVTGSRSGSQ